MMAKGRAAGSPGVPLLCGDKAGTSPLLCGDKRRAGTKRIAVAMG
jgi:hypothetical protein